jgi:anti-sigma factor RsiW
MTIAWNRPPDGPTHEELMAFADGELEPARRDEVAAWLEHHPEDRAEVEEFFRLNDLWKRFAPPDPSPAAWASVLARIETARPFRPQVPEWWADRRAWTFAGLAAAVLGAVMLGRSLWTDAPETPADEEPFPVALAGEVNIVSMDAHDADTLVGHPPVMANMEFAGPQDVQLLNAAWHEGWKAQLRQEGEVPMIVASAQEDED